MAASIAERQQALVRRMPAWVPRTLDQMLDLAAAEFPDRPYVVTDERSWTYAESRPGPNGSRRGWWRLASGRGDHVALVLGNHPEFVATKFAIARGRRGLRSPNNFLNKRANELGFVLKQSERQTADHHGSLPGPRLPEGAGRAGAGLGDAGRGRSLPCARARLRLPAIACACAPGRRKLRVARLLEGAMATIAERDPHAMSDMIFTSGTTGSPKGVMLTHDMLLRTACGSAYARAFDDGWRVLFSRSRCITSMAMSRACCRCLRRRRDHPAAPV